MFCLKKIANYDNSGPKKEREKKIEIVKNISNIFQKECKKELDLQTILDEQGTIITSFVTLINALYIIKRKESQKFSYIEKYSLSDGTRYLLKNENGKPNFSLFKTINDKTSFTSWIEKDLINISVILSNAVSSKNINSGSKSYKPLKSDQVLRNLDLTGNKILKDNIQIYMIMQDYFNAYLLETKDFFNKYGYNLDIITDYFYDLLQNYIDETNKKPILVMPYIFNFKQLIDSKLDSISLEYIDIKNIMIINQKRKQTQQGINDCYINSIIYNLYHAIPFYIHRIYKNGDSLTDIGKAIQLMYDGNEQNFCTRQFQLNYDAFKNSGKMKQQDAKDFSEYILKQLNLEKLCKFSGFVFKNIEPKSFPEKGVLSIEKPPFFFISIKDDLRYLIENSNEINKIFFGTEYELCGITLHMGRTSEGGHWNSIAKSGNLWIIQEGGESITENAVKSRINKKLDEIKDPKSKDFGLAGAVVALFRRKKF